MLPGIWYFIFLCLNVYNFGEKTLNDLDHSHHQPATNSPYTVGHNPQVLSAGFASACTEQRQDYCRLNTNKKQFKEGHVGSRPGQNISRITMQNWLSGSHLQAHWLLSAQTDKQTLVIENKMVNIQLNKSFILFSMNKLSFKKPKNRNENGVRWKAKLCVDLFALSCILTSLRNLPYLSFTWNPTEAYHGSDGYRADIGLHSKSRGLSGALGSFFVESKGTSSESAIKMD